MNLCVLCYENHALPRANHVSRRGNYVAIWPEDGKTAETCEAISPRIVFVAGQLFSVNNSHVSFVYSGAPAARTANRNPILIYERKGNPWVDFLMVIMASGIARGRVRTTTTTTESRNMAAMLQI